MDRIVKVALGLALVLAGSVEAQPFYFKGDERAEKSTCELRYQEHDRKYDGVDGGPDPGCPIYDAPTIQQMAQYPFGKVTELYEEARATAIDLVNYERMYSPAAAALEAIVRRWNQANATSTHLQVPDAAEVLNKAGAGAAAFAAMKKRVDDRRNWLLPKSQRATSTRMYLEGLAGLATQFRNMRERSQNLVDDYYCTCVWVAYALVWDVQDILEQPKMTDSRYSTFVRSLERWVSTQTTSQQAKDTPKKAFDAFKAGFAQATNEILASLRRAMDAAARPAIQAEARIPGDEEALALGVESRRLREFATTQWYALQKQRNFGGAAQVARARGVLQAAQEDVARADYDVRGWKKDIRDKIAAFRAVRERYDKQLAGMPDLREVPAPGSETWGIDQVVGALRGVLDAADLARRLPKVDPTKFDALRQAMRDLKAMLQRLVPYDELPEDLRPASREALEQDLAADAKHRELYVAKVNWVVKRVDVARARLREARLQLERTAADLEAPARKLSADQRTRIAAEAPEVQAAIQALDRVLGDYKYLGLYPDGWPHDVKIMLDTIRSSSRYDQAFWDTTDQRLTAWSEAVAKREPEVAPLEARVRELAGLPGPPLPPPGTLPPHLQPPEEPQPPPPAPTPEPTPPPPPTPTPTPTPTPPGVVLPDPLTSLDLPYWGRPVPPVSPGAAALWRELAAVQRRIDEVAQGWMDLAVRREAAVRVASDPTSALPAETRARARELLAPGAGVIASRLRELGGLPAPGLPPASLETLRPFLRAEPTSDAQRALLAIQVAVNGILSKSRLDLMMTTAQVGQAEGLLGVTPPPTSPPTPAPPPVTTPTPAPPPARPSEASISLAGLTLPYWGQAPAGLDPSRAAAWRDLAASDAVRRQVLEAWKAFAPPASKVALKSAQVSLLETFPEKSNFDLRLMDKVRTYLRGGLPAPSPALLANVLRHWRVAPETSWSRLQAAIREASPPPAPPPVTPAPPPTPGPARIYVSYLGMLSPDLPPEIRDHALQLAAADRSVRELLNEWRDLETRHAAVASAATTAANPVVRAQLEQPGKTIVQEIEVLAAYPRDMPRINLPRMRSYFEDGTPFSLIREQVFGMVHETAAFLAPSRERLATTRAALEAVEAMLAPAAPTVSTGGGATSLENEFPADAAGVTVDTEQTRWDAAKASLTRLVRAYVDRDLSGVLRELASDVTPDRAIFSNAVQEDYQAETDIMLDIELLNYRVDVARVCTSMRWNRSGIRMANGTRRVDTGTCMMCFERSDGMRLQQAQGQLPFGLADPQLQVQAQAGQPNADPENATDAPLPEGVQALVIDVDHRPGGTGNVAFLDLETGRIRKATVAGDVEGLAGQPGEDVYVATDLQATTPAGVCVHRVNGAGVIGCDGGFAQAFDALRRIDTTKLTTVTDDVYGYHFGVRTSEGNYAFLRVADFQNASYRVARDPEVNPTGTIDCP